MDESHILSKSLDDLPTQRVAKKLVNCLAEFEIQISKIQIQITSYLSTWATPSKWRRMEDLEMDDLPDLASDSGSDTSSDRDSVRSSDTQVYTNSAVTVEEVEPEDMFNDTLWERRCTCFERRTFIKVQQRRCKQLEDLRREGKLC